MKPLTPYLPIDRLQALAAGENLPEACQGSALFADISGFTPLTEYLAAQLGQQRAAEELTRLLDQVYTALIDQVHRLHGSVIGFVGDAITCWFDERGESPDSPLRAAACAFAMQQAMRPFASVPVTGNLKAALAIKIGIASGPARRFLVGDPSIQLIDSLAGETLRQMSQAEGLAQKGEILLSADCAALLGDAVTQLEWRTHPENGLKFAVAGELTTSIEPSPWPTISPEALDETKIRPWMLPLLYERLQAGDTAQPELRPAVSLFLRFLGIDYDHDEEAGSKLDACIRRAQNTIHQSDGSLLQLTIGDKGSFLYAAFGAPLAHDDDALRAVRAALELQTQLQKQGLSSQVGLARGPARTGAYGSRERCSYGVIGDDAVLAARLMTAAPPGETRCAYSIYRELHQKLNFESLPPVRVKGKAGLIPVYRPVSSQRAVTGSHFAIIGRQLERAQLEASLEALQVGQPGLLMIEGEAGIGKSRLVEELVRMARERGLSLLAGAGQSIEQQTPYRAWRDVFSAYFDLDNLSESGERQTRIQSLVERLLPNEVSRLPVLNDLLGLSLPENDLTRSLDPQLRQQNATILLEALLHIWAAERPLILILEDVHWLDSLSWDLALQVIHSLSAQRVAFLLVLVNRPLDENSPGQRVLRQLRALEITRAIALSTHAPPEILALVAQRLGVAVDTLPTPLVELVQTRSSGNPFFADELLLNLLDRGLISVSSDAQSRPSCAITGDLAQSASTLPDTLHGLILARIDRLPPERQFIIKAAAVIGRAFAFTPLQYILNRQATILERALKDHLASLKTADFTFVETIEPDLTYIFKHIITQEAAYQTLLFGQRRELHRLVAEWYEARTDVQTFLPLLAYHYRYAEDREKERSYATLAGNQAAAQYANAEALIFFSRALDLTSPDETNARYELLLSRESILHLIGERNAQAEDLNELTRLADEFQIPSKRAEAFYRRARYAEVIADFPQAISAAHSAVELAQKAGAPNLESAAHLMWGHALMRQDLEAARGQMEQALALAQAGDDHRQQAEILGWLGRVLPESDPSLARQQLGEALKLSRELNDRQLQGRILHHLAVFAAAINYDYGQAIDYYRQAVAIFHTIGDLNAEASSSYNLAVNVTHMGQLNEAQVCANLTLRIAQQIDDKEQMAFSLEMLGDLAHSKGEYALAQASLEQALSVVQPLGNDGLQGGILTSLAETLIAQGDFTRAETLLLQAKSLRENLLGSHATVDQVACLAHLELERGNLARAADYVGQFMTIQQANPTLSQANDPARDVLIAYRVLHSIGHPAAAELLNMAYTELNRRANIMVDLKLRESFLQNVPTHREIIETYLRSQGT